MSETPYDQLRYPGKFYPQASLNRIAIVARLFGLDPPALQSSRVLELGCGEGGHLIPMAHAHAGSRFLGIDLSNASVARAKALAEQTGLHNVEFRAQSLIDFPEDAGTFDYIIAHGVYSWIPEPEQQALLQLCARHLGPQGLTYISYNSYPGGHLRHILRDLTVFHTKAIEDPAEKIREARKVAELILSAMPASSAERHFLDALLKLYSSSDALVRFDLLAEENEPVYFLDFMEAVGTYGLQFVAESYFQVGQDAALPEHARNWLNAITDRLVREQYRDFITLCGFRQSVLCRSGRELDLQLSPRNMARLYLRSSLKPLERLDDLQNNQAVTFRNSRGLVVTCSEAVPKTAYGELGEAFPLALSYGELRERICRRLGGEDRLDSALESKLIRMLLASEANGVVELHVERPAFNTQVTRRPVANQLARIEAQRGEQVCAPNVTSVLGEDAILTALLPLLDGTRDRAQLLSALQLGHPNAVDTEGIERRLQLLADHGILEA